MDGLELEWTCENHCPKLKEEEISEYTCKLMRIRTLQASGFPIDADFLEYEEWLDLGRVCQMMDAHERQANRLSFGNDEG